MDISDFIVQQTGEIQGCPSGERENMKVYFPASYVLRISGVMSEEQSSNTSRRTSGSLWASMDSIWRAICLSPLYEHKMTVYMLPVYHGSPFRASFFESMRKQITG